MTSPSFKMYIASKIPFSTGESAENFKVISVRRGNEVVSDYSECVEHHTRSTGSSALAIARKFARSSPFLITLWAAIILAVFALIIWYILLLALISRLSPAPVASNGVRQIVQEWVEPGTAGSNVSAWRPDFTRDITPIACHSHNDYWRRVPLYDALVAGCTGVEADVWLQDADLRVGHDRGSLRKNRTLKSLYVDPLADILMHQNAQGQKNLTAAYRGVFDSDPSATLVLLIDFKTDGASLWPVVLHQLEPLRQNGWLTHFNGTAVVQRPITVVGTGNAPFNMVTANSTYRDIFFDAPLDGLLESDTKHTYTRENSFYASVSFRKAVGRVWFNGLSTKQITIIKDQIKAASDRGLKSRYWDTPAWPVSLRTSVWHVLEENGVGMLSVDDLVLASWWNWRWCRVIGLTLC